MSKRLDRIADQFDADDTMADDYPNRDPDFIPCNSCPWSSSCRDRGDCEAYA